MWPWTDWMEDEPYRDLLDGGYTRDEVYLIHDLAESGVDIADPEAFLRIIREAEQLADYVFFFGEEPTYETVPRLYFPDVAAATEDMIMESARVADEGDPMDDFTLGFDRDDMMDLLLDLRALPEADREPQVCMVLPSRLHARHGYR